MTERRSMGTYEELTRVLADLFDEVGPDTPEEVDAVLVEAGYDPDEVGRQMQAIAEQAMANSPVNWRNRAQQELAAERARYERTASTPSGSREDMISGIRHLISQMGQRPSQVFAYHRNLEDMSDEDLASLLSDLEYLSSQQPGQDVESGI